LDSVDEGIYNMQQRKAKMNAAIMGNAAEWKKVLEEEKKLVTEEAVRKYLKSPNGKSNNKAGLKENNENNAESFDENKAERFEESIAHSYDESF
jgi:sulfatase maturation enzyme AslB (radical SAM superfamily)